MSNILTALGLRAIAGEQPPNHAAGYLIGNWVLAYIVLNNRRDKMRLGLDHNAAPREDLAKYGEAAVQAGKITREKLDQLKRTEAAHANCVEGFPLFVAGILLAVYTGVPAETINGIGLWYTLCRLGFGLSYIYIASDKLSSIRSLFWISANVGALTALVLAGKRL